ncbi:BrxA family protein [Dokdonia sp. Dokd-P16]|uniref:BrxA family protein n=1 Tax=Dokdonia sp. Dokd-P16 TaxID=2173169 RepID=UPI0013A556B1|nr:BrxA family protein [Dokdonia sp. Dokd-P16]
MNKPESKYNANFTAGGLLHNEFNALKDIILLDDFDNAISKEIEENNLMSIDTRASRKRISQEVVRRREVAPKNFWTFFYQLNEREQKLGLFYIALKTYQILFDIHLDVAVKKFKTTRTLTTYDVTMRLDEIASKDDYVGSWSQSTLEKINTRYRRALQETELYENEQLMRSPIENNEFWEYFNTSGENWFLTACFIGL